MSTLWYARLLRVLPREVASEYSDDMVATFEAKAREARRSGRLAYVCFGARELWGLLRMGLGEWLERGRAQRRRKGSSRMDMMMRELSHATRRLLRAPGFTLAAVLTMALAFGANGAMFTLVQRVVLAPLPYMESERLISLEHGAPGIGVPRGLGMSIGMYREYRELPSLESAALYTTQPMTLSGEGAAERIDVAVVSPSLARVLDVAPLSGRWFEESEGERDGGALAILSHGMWQSRFGGARDVIGRTLRLDARSYEIIGIMPQGFAFPDERPQLYLPLQIELAGAQPAGFNFSGVARLAAGVTPEQALRDQSAVIGDLAARFPEHSDMTESLTGDVGLVSQSQPLKDQVLGSSAATLWVLLASVGVLLLIACANIANLFLVRTDERQREVAVRRALGAGGGRVAAYFMAETFVICMSAGAVGLLLAWVALDAVRATSSIQLPRMHEVHLDAATVVFMFALAVISSLAFGAMPLLRRAAAVTSVLKDAGRGNTAGAARMRLRHGLMASQVALALMLLVAAGLLVRSFDRLSRVDPGFAADSRLSFRVGLPNARYGTNELTAAFNDALLERIGALPGVQQVAYTTTLPLDGDGWGDPVEVLGRARARNEMPPIVRFRRVSRGYFDAVEIGLSSGRTFDMVDETGKTNAAVVNRAFVEQYFPNEDPIGRAVLPIGNEESDWLTIVGVVENTATYGLRDEAPVAKLYLPARSATAAGLVTSRTTSWVVHTAQPPLVVLPAIRRALAEIDGDVAMARAEPLEDLVGRARAGLAFTMLLIVTAATVALLLGIIGVYAVISYSVAQRRGEIGVRLALGARPHDVTRLIVRQSGAVIGAGVLLGLGGAFAATRLMGALLYGVAATDVITYAAVAAGLFAVALAACWLPARRAAHVSPVRAIQQ